MHSVVSKAFRVGDTEVSRVFISDHLKRLTSEERSLRFFSRISDESIDKYVSTSTKNDSFWLAVADLVTGDVIAALHIAVSDDRKTAEIGFSVEKSYSGQGLGTELMKLAVLCMKPMQVEELVLNCLSENKAVQAICKKLGVSVSSVSFDEKEGKLTISKEFSVRDAYELGVLTSNSISHPSIIAMKKFFSGWMKSFHG